MQVTHKNQLFSKKAHHGFFISSNFDWHMGSKSQGSISFSGSFYHPYNRCSLTVRVLWFYQTTTNFVILVGSLVIFSPLKVKHQTTSLKRICIMKCELPKRESFCLSDEFYQKSHQSSEWSTYH